MKRVLVVRSDLLVAEGVERLLTQDNDLEVMSVDIDDEKSIRKELNAFHPDVLVLDESLLVADPSALFGLFEDFSSLRVVIIETSSNRLHIYDKSDVMITKASDLLAVIQNKRNQYLSYL